MDHGAPRDVRRGEMLLDRHDQEYGGESEEQEFHIVQDVDGMISKDRWLSWPIRSLLLFEKSRMSMSGE
jgi:hypothetical protein